MRLFNKFSWVVCLLAMLVVPLGGMAQLKAGQHKPQSVFAHAPKRAASVINRAPHAMPLRSIVPAQRRAAGEAPTIYGIVLNDPYEYFVGSFKAEAGMRVTNVYADDYLDASGCAVYALGKLYVNCMEQEYQYITTTQYVFDTQTWNLDDVREDLYQSSSASCMAYDATTDRVYGVFYDDSETQYMGFGTMNMATGEPEYIRFYEEDETPMVMAVDNDGRIYAIDVNGLFVEINKDNGELTRIGHTDVKPRYMQSAVIDQQTGRFYWAAFTDQEQAGLYEVNKATGEATLISNFPNNEEFVGLYIPETAASESAPADPTDITFDFQGPSLTGNIVFTVPTTTLAGDPLIGQVTAHLNLGGKSYEAVVEPGQQCSIAASVDNGGDYYATVWLTGDGGMGNKVQQYAWLGYDYPSAVGNLKLVKDGTQAIVTWDAPTTGRHGGYVNPDEVVYFITPSNGRTIENYTSTTLTQDQGDYVGKLRYYVRPVQHELVGEGAYTNSENYGDASAAWDVPCEMQFGGGDFKYCAVIDANSDGTTWQYSWSGYAECNAAATGADDDWLITPKFKLQAGQVYKVTCEMAAKFGLFTPEVLEVKMGNEPTAQGMTRLLATETLSGVYRSAGMEQKVYEVTVEADGDYCFGFHAITEGGDAVYVSSFSIEQTASLSAPAAVTDLTLTAGAQGALEAQISFKAPTQNLKGEELTEIGRIDILRGDEVITSISNPAPGSECSYTDTGAQQGNNTYKVIPYTADGKGGAVAEASVYCGVEIPALPGNVLLTLNDDQVMLTWTKPTQGIHGGYVSEEGMYFTIYDPTYGDVIADGITGTSFTANVTKIENRQYGVSLAIGVTNVAGSNDDVMISNTVIVGDPYELPVSESFNRGLPAYQWWRMGECMDDDGWEMVERGDPSNTGYARFYGTANWGGEEQSMILGKVSLNGADNPTLRFTTHCYPEQCGKLLVEVADEFSGEYQVIKEIDYTNWPGSWTPVEISLSDYVGKDYIHVAFHAIPAAEDCNIYIDDIVIRDVKDRDVAFKAFNVSGDEVTVGKTTLNVDMTIQNLGVEPLVQGDYTVNVYAGDRAIATYDGQALQSYESYTISCVYTPLTADPDHVDLYAVIDYAADQDLDNNTTSATNVWVHKPQRPAVDDLKAEAHDGTTVLTWSQPDLSGTPVQTVTDGFEEYLPFKINHAGEWTMYDVDGLPTTTNYFFEGYDQPMAYIVMNPGMVERLGGATLADTWPAHGGEQYMATFCSVGGDNDDWLITPELSGNAQTITFFARSGSETQGHESIEVYYSTTDNQRTSMTQLGEEVYRVPAGEWTQYSFELPEGTKYFAVRCTSHDRCALMLDDFTYEAAARPLEVELVGYHVYRNGERITDQPITDTMWVDNRVDPTAIYYVTAVYDLGESEPSNEVTVDYTGIEALRVDPLQTPVYDLAGRRVTQLQPGQVYVTRGRKFVNK